MKLRYLITLLTPYVATFGPYWYLGGEIGANAHTVLLGWLATMLSLLITLVVMGYSGHWEELDESQIGETARELREIYRGPHV